MNPGSSSEYQQAILSENMFSLILYPNFSMIKTMIFLTVSLFTIALDQYNHLMENEYLEIEKALFST